MRKTENKHVGPPYEVDFLAPYKIAFVDGGIVRHLVQPKFNTLAPALVKAKELAESNGMPTFIENSCAYAHPVKRPLFSHEEDFDPFGKMERYDEYRKIHPLPPRR